MPKKIKDLIYTNIFGRKIPVPQHEKTDGTYVETGENNPLPVQLNGDYVGLTIADAPANAQNGNSFYAIDENGGEGQAYLYFNGEWRAI